MDENQLLSFHVGTVLSMTHEQKATIFSLILV